MQVTGVGLVVMMPVIGNLSDMYGRKALLTLPMTLSILPFAILAFGRTTKFYYTYYVLRTITGIYGLRRRYSMHGSCLCGRQYMGGKACICYWNFGWCRICSICVWYLSCSLHLNFSHISGTYIHTCLSSIQSLPTYEPTSSSNLLYKQSRLLPGLLACMHTPTLVIYVVQAS
nr:hippocampus abundant transcript-like protein 1 [Ipomoea batatas]